MSLNNIEDIAAYIVADGKGILAADESNPTCGKRFDSIGVESTEENRRDYREMLFRSKGMKGNIGGVILFFIIWLMKIYYKTTKLSFLLMVPYLLWSSFALLLNTSILYLN